MLDEFPSFRRLDMHKWSRKVFYPGCFLVLLPRMLIGCSIFFGGTFVVSLLYIGQGEGVLTGWRRRVQKSILRDGFALVLMCAGVKLTKNRKEASDVDYSKYLGPNWREMPQEVKRVPTMVANHTSFLEIPALCTLEPCPSFLVSAIVFAYPMAGFCVNQVQAMAIDKGSGTEALERTIERI